MIFCDGPCLKCDPHNPDPACPECRGTGMVGWCEDRPLRPRTETPWSRALEHALIERTMYLGEVVDATGIRVTRISDLKNGMGDPPTDEERLVLERVLGFGEVR